MVVETSAHCHMAMTNVINFKYRFTSLYSKLKYCNYFKIFWMNRGEACGYPKYLSS
ncbi:hypothetical protein RINTHH_16850 [Richelia intracellularis HH01]|uniref:Uncharacterized protein n=1 Tax=Richelia intracellularis HH01 TaxID=1165094 RepID=M1X326_9NOST|nr:hypothetical protein RINTHH_16850 [Richelia intracellularis HH01]